MTAEQEYGALRGTGPMPVPVENTGGRGTATSQKGWRKTVFRNELMGGFVGQTSNRLSRMTVGSLQDLGYKVDLTAAEPYILPNHLELAERGLLTVGAAHESEGIMLSKLPIILSEDSLA
jgi:hypothetical protein